jgi:hypothetical protein
MDIGPDVHHRERAILLDLLQVEYTHNSTGSTLQVCVVVWSTRVQKLGVGVIRKC